MPVPNLLSLVGLLTWAGYEVVLRSRDPSALNWRARTGDRGSTYLLLDTPSAPARQHTRRLVPFLY